MFVLKQTKQMIFLFLKLKKVSLSTFFKGSK